MIEIDDTIFKLFRAGADTARIGQTLQIPEYVVDRILWAKLEDRAVT